MSVTKQLLALTLCMLLSYKALALDKYIEDTDRFPGWRGELPSSIEEVAEDGSVGFGELGKEVWRGRVEQISWKPRAFLYHDFLSEEECDHLMSLSKGHLTKSTVVDNDSGKSVDSTVRTSSGTFLSKHQDEVIARIEKRISMVTMLPEDNGEGMQILRYVDGQKYEPHSDAFHDQYNQRAENGGQRIATVLMYLTTPLEGGETVFPGAEKKVEGPGWSECARRGLAVHPKRGAALLFYSLKPNGEVDAASTHGSCPTLAGEKWSATKWIHVGPFQMGAEFQKAKWRSGDCTDERDECQMWANEGECEKNPGFMHTSCRKACGKCSPSAAQDAPGAGGKRVGGRKGAISL